MVGRSNHGVQTESEVNVGDKGISSGNTINPTQVNYPQVDLHTLEENIVKKVRSKVDCLMMMVETRVEDTVFTAIESLVIPRLELALKSANAPLGRNLDANMLEPD